MKKRAILFALALCVALAGCDQPAPPQGGDPDALDIWYFMEGEQPLELPTLGLSWPIDQPYQWEGAESK